MIHEPSHRTLLDHDRHDSRNGGDIRRVAKKEGGGGHNWGTLEEDVQAGMEAQQQRVATSSAATATATATATAVGAKQKKYHSHNKRPAIPTGDTKLNILDEKAFERMRRAANQAK